MPHQSIRSPAAAVHWAVDMMFKLIWREDKHAALPISFTGLHVYAHKREDQLDLLSCHINWSGRRLLLFIGQSATISRLEKEKAFLGKGNWRQSGAKDDHPSITKGDQETDRRVAPFWIEYGTTHLIYQEVHYIGFANSMCTVNSVRTLYK
ncbi:uncharacterized protein LOC106866558 isoform X2 [Brachypodium distachyon]|uniref:uncharacterized protein LOC106866558 isoform X2 n=1 Tax=Brachypodium distachyon TaxID=15368 RepID=UPI000D0D0729|nr:uncharacterized protein LOC106866558 isoform X2 [Brachypodium distachyon]|eukprot:XP_024317568.1 uncharacterized protein LOC106866558 isoform X2 [Brachypodium distachyon]